MSQKRTGRDDFVNNGGENHLFDPKMNKAFAKFAKMSDNYPDRRNQPPEAGKMTHRHGRRHSPAAVNPVQGAAGRNACWNDYCIDNRILL